MASRHRVFAGRRWQRSVATRDEAVASCKRPLIHAPGAGHDRKVTISGRSWPKVMTGRMGMVG
jgi:hypothetical protein